MDFDQLVILPVLLPMIGGIIAYLLPDNRHLKAACALLAMFTALVCSVDMLLTIRQSGIPAVFQVGGWPAPFGITLVMDMLSGIFVVMSQLVLLTGVLYAAGSRESCVDYPVFYPLFLFLGTGLSGAFLAGDMFNLFVFVELLAIASTVLTSISDDLFGTEAAYKYFYMSQLAAIFLLLAIGALYVSSGTLNMAHLAVLIAPEPGKLLVPLAVAFLMAAFMIKSATFPFHFWQPDFHTAAPTPVSAMLSSVVVKLGVYGFIRMTTLVFTAYAGQIRLVLVGMGLVGIVFGGISAMGTHNAKRMLAYSTLAQVGFVLVGIGWGTPLAMAAAIVFAFNHSIAKSAMLMLAGYVASRAPVKSAAFDVVSGVGTKLPMSGVLFFIGCLGLAGIPPTNGFISKMLIFRSGIEAGQIWVLMIMGFAGTFTLVYCIRAFMRIWWRVPAEDITIKAVGDRLFAPAILVVLILVLGIFAEPLVGLSLETTQWLSDPGDYIRAVLGG